jgi:putative ABC transport system permease protein
MDALLQDLRYGLRTLRKAPGFTIVAVLTLALGIGANAAMFTIVSAVLLQALPFEAAGQLVRIESHFTTTGQRDAGLSIPELDDLRARTDIFDQVAGMFPADAALTGGEHATRVELLGTSANYFTLLHATPELGRVFGPEDDTPGFSETVVISDGLWRRVFGADPHIIGRRLRLDNDGYSVVGVMPPGFHHPGPTVTGDVEVWAATGFRADPFPKPQRAARVLPGAIARLRPGVTPERARQVLESLRNTWRQEFAGDYPERAGFSIDAVPLQDALVHDSRMLLSVLMGAAALILLIACVNIANLLLVRATGRQREMAARAATGASRARLIQQTLTESVLLAVLSGGVALAVTWLGMPALVLAIPSGIPRLDEIAVGGRVVAFGFGIALAAGLLFGVMPAVRASNADLSLVLRDGARVAGAPGQNRLRRTFVVVELALSLVLLVGAGLLLRTFWRLIHTDPGFRPDAVRIASVWIPVPNDPKTDHYATVQQRTEYVRESLRAALALPGVEAAAMSTTLPLSGRSNRIVFFTDNHVEPEARIVGEFVSVTPGYFSTLGAPVFQGRDFTEDDDATRPNVAILDRSTAQRCWPGQNPIGRELTIRFGAGTRKLKVIGLVGDIKHDGLDADRLPHIYLSLYQLNSKVMSLAVRTSGTLPEGELKHALERIDPDLPIFGITTMNEALQASLAARRFAACGVIVFAAIATLLAAIGLYGVIGYVIKQRTHEIGVRMALGARPSDVLALLARESAVVVGIGVGAGLILAALFARFLSRLLFGVTATDALTFAGAAAALIAVAFVATVLPVRRAARIDPIVALRSSDSL